MTMPESSKLPRAIANYVRQFGSLVSNGPISYWFLEGPSIRFRLYNDGTLRIFRRLMYVDRLIAEAKQKDWEKDEWSVFYASDWKEMSNS